MKKYILFLLFASTVAAIQAQDFQQISAGASYATQSFYDLDTKTSVDIASSDWDIILTTFGLQDAGIHINEATNISFGAPAPSVELYLAESAYENITAFDTTLQRLHNDESSWAYGAFNVDRAAGDQLDYGWGRYNPMTRQVVGDEAFVIKLRSGEFKKVMIESLDATVYNIKYANLDGSDEQTAQVDKGNHSGGFAFFSFETGSTLDVDVSGFDLLMTRYTTPLVEPESGDTLQYTVTGILSGLGVEAAEVTGENPVDVVPTNDLEFSSQLDIVGFDWKQFSFQSGWALPEDVTYFIRSNQGQLFKLVFVDFEGSATGIATFELAEVEISSTQRTRELPNEVTTFPNPTQDYLNVRYTLPQAQQVSFMLFATNGQAIWSEQATEAAGEQLRTFQLPQLPKGQYLLTIRAGDYQSTRQVSIY